MTAKLRWKKSPAETGLRKIGAPPRGYTMHDGSIRYAVVSPYGGGWTALRGWYWVAGWGSGVPHKNTCGTLVKTPEEAKAQALEYVKNALKSK